MAVLRDVGAHPRELSAVGLGDDEGAVGFEVQRQAGTRAVALQGLFDAGQKIVAANQKLHGLIEHVQFFAQRVLERPGQCDHTLLGNFHRRIVAV